MDQKPLRRSSGKLTPAVFPDTSQRGRNSGFRAGNSIVEAMKRSSVLQAKEAITQLFKVKDGEPYKSMFKLLLSIPIKTIFLLSQPDIIARLDWYFGKEVSNLKKIKSRCPRAITLYDLRMEVLYCQRMMIRKWGEDSNLRPSKTWTNAPGQTNWTKSISKEELQYIYLTG